MVKSKKWLGRFPNFLTIKAVKIHKTHIGTWEKKKAQFTEKRQIWKIELVSIAALANKVKTEKL